MSASDSETFATLAVGDPVVMSVPSYTRAGFISVRGVVVRVGRKYLYVEERQDRGLARRFDRSTGLRARADAENSGYGGGCIYTPEQWSDKQERKKIDDRLREDHGWRWADSFALTSEKNTANGKGWTNDQCRELLALLDRIALELNK